MGFVYRSIWNDLHRYSFCSRFQLIIHLIEESILLEKALHLNTFSNTCMRFSRKRLGLKTYGPSPFL